MFDLRSQIGGCSGKKPVALVGTDSKLGLGTCVPRKSATAQRCAVSATAIPLRKAAPGCRTEDQDAHSARLELRANVRIDFAAQNDFFKYGSSPDHCVHLGSSDISPAAGVGLRDGKILPSQALVTPERNPSSLPARVRRVGKLFENSTLGKASAIAKRNQPGIHRLLKMPGFQERNERWFLRGIDLRAHDLKTI